MAFAQRHQAALHQAEVDLAPIQVNAADLDIDPGADGITDAGALTTQFLAHFVKTKILAAQFGDVHQAFDIHRIERDEQAKGRSRGNHAAVFLT